MANSPSNSMEQYLISGSTLDSIANAINDKTGGSSAMTPAEMVTAIGSISGGGGILELIGEETISLQEYTDTANLETINTNINISNTDYFFGVITISCDGTPDGNADWGGITICFFIRYSANRNLMSVANTQTKGAAFLKLSDFAAYYNGDSLGVWVPTNTPKVRFCRKCHGTALPKIMGGNYTIKAYGFVSL